MFVLPLKTGPRVDIQSALTKWLDDPHDPSTDMAHHPLDFILPKPKYRSAQIAPELMRLQSLRNDLLLSLPKPEAHAHALADRGLEDAMEYHASVLAFETQGFSSDKCCSIPYRGAFSSQEMETHGSLVWDRAVTLYNIAALIMYQAAHCETAHRESCKQAISHCQQAAYILQTCQDLCANMTEISTVDLSAPLLTVAASSCLAYAQSCICKMVAVSSESPSKATLSVLMQGAHTLYNTVLEQAQDPRLQSDMPNQARELAAEAKLHSMIYAVRARWVQSQLVREEHKFGIEISCLKVCHDQCNAVRKFLETNSFNTHAPMAAIREFNAVAPQVLDRLEEVIADNRSTYHEIIPDAPPALTGKQLAKQATSLPTAMLQPAQALLFQPLTHAEVAL